eukprot:13667715-Alexandrium_andersonii.AAC.1
MCVSILKEIERLRSCPISRARILSLKQRPIVSEACAQGQFETLRRLQDCWSAPVAAVGVLHSYLLQLE